MQKRMGQTAKAAEATPHPIEPRDPTRKDDHSIFACPRSSLCLSVSGDRGVQWDWGTR